MGDQRTMRSKWVARLRDAADDGLEPAEYRVEELGRQAAAGEATEAFSAVDAAAFESALGAIKFVLPNVYGVFLHGTPAPVLFSRDRRDFSHGCVRVADPLALALWVLQGERDWWPDRIRAAIAEGRTRSVKVGQPPHVVLFYMTAAVDPQDGTIQFSDDVYGHDARLDASLRAPIKGDKR